MAPRQQPSNKNSLSELAYSLFSGRPYSSQAIEQRPWVAAVDRWLLQGIVIGWMLLLLTGLPVALLALFRLNYTVEWLIAGFWLLMLSLTATGVSAIINWMGRSRTADGRPLSAATLISAIGILLLVPCVSIVLVHTFTGQGLPLLTVSAAALGALVMAGSGVMHLVTVRDQPLVARVAFLFSLAAFGGGLVLSVIGQHYEALGIAPSTYQVLNNAGFVLLCAAPWGILVGWPRGKQR